MFYELVGNSTDEADITKPFFTTKDHNLEKEGTIYWSMKNIYFSYDHIPGFEYEFALDVFGSWDHWVMLCESSGTKDLVQGWRDELSIKLQAKALKALFKTAVYEGAKGTPAAKFIADKGWEVKRGRPSKLELEKERKIQAGVSKELQEDMERLGLSIVSGGKS